MIRPILFAAALAAGHPALAHQCDEPPQPESARYEADQRNRALEATLAELLACDPDRMPGAPVGDAEPIGCGAFVEHALRAYWGHDDFDAPGLDRPMTTGEISRLEDQGFAARGWTKLGRAGEQAVLDRAETMAEEGRAVLAVKPGHVAFILPGGFAPSGSWGLDMPMAAQLPQGAPGQGFVGCRLSWAFRSAQKDAVTVYAK